MGKLKFFLLTFIFTTGLFGQSIEPAQFQPSPYKNGILKAVQKVFDEWTGDTVYYYKHDSLLAVDSVYITNDSIFCYRRNNITRCDTFHYAGSITNEIQKIDTFEIYDTNKLRISLQNDNEIFKTVELPASSDTQDLSIDSLNRVFTISLTDGGSVKFKDSNPADSTTIDDGFGTYVYEVAPNSYIIEVDTVNHIPTLWDVAQMQIDSFYLLNNGQMRLKQHGYATKTINSIIFGGSSLGGTNYLPIFSGPQSITNYWGTGLAKVTAGVLSTVDDNSTNWNTAYNKKINSLAFSGTTTKTLTLTYQDGNTISNTFTDNNSGGTVTSITATSPLTGGTITTSGSIGIQTASGSQAGAISSTDWTLFNSKFTLPTLASGSVLFSNGTTISENNNSFFWDNTNERLGIGTKTPTYNLDLRVGSSTDIFRITTASKTLWTQTATQTTLNKSGLKVNSLSLDDAISLDYTTGNIGFGIIPTVKMDIQGATPVVRIVDTNGEITTDQTIAELRFYSKEGDGNRISGFMKSVGNETYGRKSYLSFGTSITNNANATEGMRLHSTLRINALDTDNTAPTTSGTTKMVVSDANGDLSSQTIPTDTDIFWTGTSTNLVAATGRTSLGGTTIGQSMFTLTNPSAITFPRFNANNTVSALNASDFRTAIGAGTFTLPTLTSGSVLFSNGSTIAQDNDNLFFDDTNNRLGIGNIAPAKTLHVAGGARITDLAGSYNRLVYSNANGDLANVSLPTFQGFLIGNTTGGFTWTNLNSAEIFVGNSSNYAQARTMSGDATIDNTGVVTVADNSHLHNSSTITTDIVSSVENVANDGGNIDLIGDGITITGDNTANTVTFAIGQKFYKAYASDSTKCASTWHKIKWNNEIFDSGPFTVDAANYTIQFPSTGFYEVETRIMYVNNNTANESVQSRILLNGNEITHDIASTYNVTNDSELETKFYKTILGVTNTSHLLTVEVRNLYNNNQYISATNKPTIFIKKLLN